MESFNSTFVHFKRQDYFPEDSVFKKVKGMTGY